MIDIFPLEIIYYILRFLSFEDKLNCRKVCRHFRDYFPICVEMKYHNIDKLVICEKNFAPYLNYIYDEYFSKIDFTYILNMISFAMIHKNVGLVQWMFDNHSYFIKLKYLRIDADKLIKFYNQEPKKCNMISIIYTLMNIKIDQSEKKFILLSYKFIYRYSDILVNADNISIFRSYIDCNDKHFEL